MPGNYLRKSLKKFRRKRYIFKISGAAILILIIAGGIWYVWRGGRVSLSDIGSNGTISENNSTEPALVDEVKKTDRRLIDGLFVVKGKENPPLVGVMVENMVDAQPISGIDKANLVFEAVTEANITRFLAIYAIDDEILRSAQDATVSSRDFEIGPVRSARPYYLNWAAELGALYAHVGNSPEADKLIKQGVVSDLDQWFQSQYFKRVASKLGPHNVYTSIDLLKTAAGALNFLPKANFSSWQFKDDASVAEQGKVAKISVGYVAPYNVEWRYNQATNEYTRYQWGGQHETADDNVIKAKNIAVAWETMKVLDSVGRKQFGTIGKGKAVVFRDGQAITGTWSKPSQTERMRFFDAGDSEVIFNAGATWVEIVPAGYGVKY